MMTSQVRSHLPSHLIHLVLTQYTPAIDLADIDTADTATSDNNDMIAAADYSDIGSL